MKKTVNSLIISLIILGLFSSTVLAENSATSTSSLTELINNLKVQISTLETQIENLQKARAELEAKKEEVKETKGDIQDTVQLIKKLRKGMSGDDIKLLQEMLATDPEIYPEGLITGYFGALTEKAVRKFQLKACLEQVGEVGPKTLAKINELLREGAGKSGKVPPGLLTAPGIRKKFCYSTSTEDVLPPVISGLMATSTTPTTTNITWVTDEKSNSKLWYGTSTPVVLVIAIPVVSSSVLTLNHNLALSGLNASTTYYYRVTSTDGSANTATSTEQSFVTLP